MRLSCRSASLLAALASAMSFPQAALAAWPDKPLRLVVPFPTGGAADLMGRSLSTNLAQRLGQPVVLESRGGAGGAIAVEAVAQAAPDGYSLLLATMGTHAINPALYAKLRYDPLRDFTAVSLTHATPRVLVVHPSVPATSVASLIVHARSRPGELTYGSAGSGSSSHLAGELFAAMAGVRFTHVPYKGSAPALVDLLAGRISMSFDSIAVHAEPLKAGKLRAIGVTSPQPVAALPGVPPIARGDPSMRGYEVANWLGIVGPAGMPREVVARLGTELEKIAGDDAVRVPLVALGIEPMSSSPQAFTELIRSEIPKWALIVKASGARAD